MANTICYGKFWRNGYNHMSMVFHVKDPAMLDDVKAGDKVQFQAEKANGQYFVTRIEPVR